MGLVPSTAKASRACGNFSGLRLEQNISQAFHQQGTPLLVSSLILRERNLGQVDLARLGKDQLGWFVEVGEVKSSVIGEENFERLQKKRVWGAISFLSSLFGRRGKLTVIVG